MSRVPAACRSSPQTTCSWVRIGTPTTILAGYDGLTKAFFANVVPCKGTNHGYAERALAHNVLSTGHQKVILQSGQEPSIIDVNTKPARTSQPKSCTKKVQSETATPTGALSERTKPSKGQIRAIKDYTERQIGATIGLDSSVFEMAWTSCSMDIDDVPHWQ